MSDLETYSQLLTSDQSLCEQSLTLSLGEYGLRIRSNSAALIDKLAGYFSHVPPCDASQAMVEILAIERQPPELPVNFIDWKREPGKTGRKDSYFDFDAGRLVRKVRTGMVFLQSQQQLIACGPCLQYDNQVINYINSQYMNWLQNHDWLICHASGIVRNNQCMAMAGFSGGGKSTLMLHLLEHADINYLTNDRLFIKTIEQHTQAVGIPKLPRINPGTIVHNPRLHPLIPADQRERLLAMPTDELWHLEEKYDAHIDQLYGEGRIQSAAELHSLLILNWQRDTDEQTTVTKLDLAQRQELLSAVMKSPGPFYQRTDGSFLMDDETISEQPYLEVLQNIAVYEMTGRIDFDRASQLLKSIMAN
jgi:HprK-related kinase B